MAHILVVEDEASIAAGLEDNLAFEGHAVDVVGNGFLAEERARTGNYDLIILDVMLPGQDGFEVCRRLRAAGLRVPIVLLTARAEERDKVLGLEIGADDYVTKPFSPAELAARVKAVLRRTGEAGDVYDFGDLRIDFQRAEVSRGRKIVPVTAMEMRILRVLLRHRGRVVSAEQLRGEVWGADVHLSDRVVYTHMNNLRTKLERNPSKPVHLVGVRGVGYRFEA